MCTSPTATYICVKSLFSTFTSLHQRQEIVLGRLSGKRSVALRFPPSSCCFCIFWQFHFGAYTIDFGFSGACAQNKHTQASHLQLPSPLLSDKNTQERQHMHMLGLSRNQNTISLAECKYFVCFQMPQHLFLDIKFVQMKVKKQQAVPANPSSSAGSLCFTFTALSNKMTYKWFDQTSCSNKTVVAFFSFAAACFLSQSLCACHSVWS